VGSAESLAAWGILRATEVVAIAAETRLALPAAATLLEKESGGGRNVWGSDPVPTAGAYVKGGEVTRDNYRAYRAALAAGTAGTQGVGPCQLTWRGYQDAADQLGGCWQWQHNVRVGFTTLRQLQAVSGVRDGFRRYNGSGPMAERYADDAMAKLQRWTDRLGEPAPAPAPREDEDDMTPEERAALFEVRDLLRALKPGVRLPGRSAALAQTVDDHFGWALTAAGRADDAARIAEQVAVMLRDRPALVAAEVVDELVHRLGG
jgi:hypothetical protein